MFREMRRFKELLGEERGIEILKRNRRGSLGLMGDNDYGQGVGIRYVYIDGKVYLDCGKRGEKIDGIIKDEKGCFWVIDEDDIVGEKYSRYLRRVIGLGKVDVVEDMNEMGGIGRLVFMKY